MVELRSTVDFDTEPLLQEGVRLLGGEPRARHVYTEPGATSDVQATWQDILSDKAIVVTQEQAIDENWFGPVTDRVRPRIGNVLAAALGETGIIRSDREKMESALVGVHGSLTPAEMRVPFLTFVD